MLKNVRPLVIMTWLGELGQMIYGWKQYSILEIISYLTENPVIIDQLIMQRNGRGHFKKRKIGNS